MNCKLEFLFHGTREKDTYIGLHQHSCYELVYYLNGSGKTVIHDVEYQFISNTFSIIKPFTPHDERRFYDTEVFFIGFSISDDRLLLQEGLFEAANNEIKNLLLRMKEEFTQKKSLYTTKLNLLTSEIAIELYRQLSDKIEATMSMDKLQYAINYMNEHFQQKIGISTLAKLTGYSHDRFRHLFKEVTHEAPLQYLFRKRMNHAQMLLQHTDLSISQIAYESGYSNDAQFCNLFKKVTKETPRHFRLRINAAIDIISI